MKKIIYSAMAVAMLATTSCKDDFAESFVGDEATVEFSISTPEIGTRAFSDGTTATVLQYAVYDAAGEKLPLGGQKEIKGSTTVSLELTTGESYQVIFWAAADGAPYTVTFTDEIEDAKMEVSYANAKSNDEKRDAFYKYHEFTVSGAQTERIELRRPFAQLNIGTSDYTNAGKAGYTPTKSAVTVKNIYSTLNLASGAVSDDVEATFDYNAIPGKVTDVNAETFPVTGYEYLAMNYLLVPADKGLVNVEFGYKEENGKAKTRTISNVPVQRNYRTNIYGKLLTSTVDVNVEIEPDFDEPAHGLVALQNAALNGGEVTLTEDVVLTTPLEVYGKMTINLNGNTITTTEKETGRHHYAIDNYATLVIEGKGAINARGIQNFGEMTINGDITITNVDTNGGSAIWNEGELVINGGTFKTNNQAGEGSYGSALNTQVGGKAVVNGGTFEAYSQLTYAILNYGETVINDATVKGKHGAVGSSTGCITEINGGSFELMENPGVSDHCAYYVSDIRGGKFTLGNNTDSGAQVFCESTIAAGYKAIEKYGKYYVVPAEAVVVTTANELTEALANGGNIAMTQYITTEAATTAPYGNKYAFKMDGGVLNGNGYELNMECYGDDYGIMTSGGTIKNVIIQEGCRAVMIMYPQSDIILDNVNIGGNGVLYPINTGEAGASGVKLIVTNSILAGWTSYGLIESASFTNVEFKQGTYYNNIYGRVLKPYVNTTLTNCTFVEHMNLDLSALTADHKVVMKNCKVNGQVVTASTFTIPTTDAQYDTELFTVDLPSWASSINDCIVFE